MENSITNEVTVEEHPQSSSTAPKSKVIEQKNDAVNLPVASHLMIQSYQYHKDDTKTFLKQKALDQVFKLAKVINSLESSVYKSGAGKSKGERPEKLNTKNKFGVSLEYDPSIQDREFKNENISEENIKLRQQLEKMRRNIVDLATNYEDLEDQLQRKHKEIRLLQTQTVSSQSSATEEFPSMVSDASDELEMLSHGFSSIPTMISSLNNDESTSSLNVDQKIISLRRSMKQLTDMNAQWQTYNRTRLESVKKLERKVKDEEREVTNMEEQIKGRGDSNSSTFTPIQQIYIDNEYQRIRQKADRFKDQRDATLEDSRSTVARCREKRVEAEKGAIELQKRLERLQTDVRRHEVLQEELQTALMVATRNSQAASLDQQQINSLREAARQCEEDLKKVNEEYEAAIRENAALKEQLRQRRPNNVQQTIINRLPGGDVTMTRRGGETLMFSHGSSGSDIEID